MTTATNASETTAPKTCGCWCGEPLAGKSTFRQGHDQRLVSRLAHELVGGALSPEAKSGLKLTSWDESGDIQDRIDELTAAVGRIYSAGLASKVNSAAMRRWEKAGKGKPAAAAPVATEPVEKPAEPKPARRRPAAAAGRRKAAPKAAK
jgi:hypothetical protein